MIEEEVVCLRISGGRDDDSSTAFLIVINEYYQIIYELKYKVIIDHSQGALQ